jgi:hypothetical protein
MRDKFGKFTKGHPQSNTGRTFIKKGQHISKKTEFKRGQRPHNWKGKTVYRGYAFIYSPKHPYCSNKNYVSHSRLVAEKCLGRYLKEKEVIHHINGIRDDDRPENLYLFSTNSEHRKYHGNQYMKPKKKLISNLPTE